MMVQRTDRQHFGEAILYRLEQICDVLMPFKIGPTISVDTIYILRELHGLHIGANSSRSEALPAPVREVFPK